MKIYYWLSLGAVLFLMSCKSDSNKDELDIMYDQVMAIHDEVMPKMRDINRAKRGLKKIEAYEIDSFIVAQIKELDDADEAMMAWMAAFKKPDKKDIVTAKRYYDQQLDEIKAVRDDMLGAIERGNNLLETKQIQ